MLEFVSKLPVVWQVTIYVLEMVIGIFCLMKFCDLFVDSASAIAKKMKIPSLIIGLTIVAIGTSCPELTVSVFDSISALKEGAYANIAIGNVVGSNISNILLVLGFSVLFTPIFVNKSILKREYPFLLVVSGLLVVFICFFGIGSITGNYAVTRWESLILVVLIFVYILFLIYFAKKDRNKNVSVEKVDETKQKKLWVLIILTIVGATGIALGGELVVLGAKGGALLLADAAQLNRDLAESLIGLTVVAVGTSLPELVTSVNASKKGENELALGNIIGSNIFNIVFVLGISGLVNPLTTGSQVVVDVLVMMVATVLVFLLSLKGKLKKSDGIILLLLYVAYIVYLIIRTVL